MNALANKFTVAQKIACLEREIALRKSVFPGVVKRSRMTQERADHEINCMEEILSNYVLFVNLSTF